jgi:hypothetical protein
LSGVAGFSTHGEQVQVFLKDDHEYQSIRFQALIEMLTQRFASERIYFLAHLGHALREAYAENMLQ